MTGRFFLNALLVAAIGGIGALPAATIQAEAGNYTQSIRIGAGKSLTNQRLKLGVNKSVVVEVVDGVRDVLVSNPKVADAVVRSARRVYIMGGEVPGQTNIFLFGRNGRQIANFELTVELDTSDLTRMLRSMLETSTIRASSVNGNIVLAGSVRTPADAKRAFDLAARFAGDPKKVMTTLSVRGKEQVHLKVVIAEVQRTIIKQLGIDLHAILNSGNTALNVVTENPFTVLQQTLSSSVATGTYAIGESGISGSVRAMEQNGLMKLLAEPTLTAISGESASFLVGGEFPVPIGRNDNTVTIEFKKFGIGLDFTPVVMSGGRISMRVKTEVSEISSDEAFQLRGGGNAAAALTIPGLRVRRAESTVELPSGGSLVMAGLIKEDVRQALNGIPGLMKLPILGTLFKSRDYRKSQTELVVFVTPYLVKPVAASSIKRPDSYLAPASDASTIFLNRLNRMYRMTDSTTGTGRYHGRIGFIYE